MRTMLTWFVLLGMGTGAGICTIQIGTVPDAPGDASAGGAAAELTETAEHGLPSLVGNDLQPTTLFAQRAAGYGPSGEPQDGLPALPSFPPATPGMGSPAPVSSAASAPALPPSLPPGNASSVRTAPLGSQDNAVLPPVYPSPSSGPAGGSSPTAPRSLIPNSPPPAALSSAAPAQGAMPSSLPPASAPSSGSSTDARPRVTGGTMPNALRGPQPNTPALGTPPRSPPGSAVRGQEIAYGSAANSGSGMRQVNDGSQAPNGRLNPKDIATGLPYVTPAPRGRYPTSPYNYALFQNAAYQRQSTSGDTGSLPGQLTSAQVTPSRPGPPAQPGIYPTSYLQTSGTLPPASNAGAAAPAVACPPSQAQPIYSTNNAGYQPMMTMGQEGYNVQIGRGLLGQPTVYVPGQPMRNFLRYIFP